MHTGDSVGVVVNATNGGLSFYMNKTNCNIIFGMNPLNSLLALALFFFVMREIVWKSALTREGVASGKW